VRPQKIHGWDLLACLPTAALLPAALQDGYGQEIKQSQLPKAWQMVQHLPAVHGRSTTDIAFTTWQDAGNKFGFFKLPSRTCIQCQAPINFPKASLVSTTHNTFTHGADLADLKQYLRRQKLLHSLVLRCTMYC